MAKHFSKVMFPPHHREKKELLILGAMQKDQRLQN